MIKDAAELIRIAGVGGTRRLVQSSNQLKSYARGFALMHALLALEKCGLNARLLTNDGLDVSACDTLDTHTLRTICEYLYEIGVLKQPRRGKYRASNKASFELLLQTMYACYAYHEPARDMYELLTKRYQYGKDVVRNDRYDALASAGLTSLFSYGFSRDLLEHAGATSLMDLGCGTGEYLVFLENRRFAGKLYGVDFSADAIGEGRSRGFESERVKLVVGDLFDLAAVVDKTGGAAIDVLSYMFVLHEFSDTQILQALSAVRKCYSGARILLTELIGKSSDEVRRESTTAFPELKLVHQLSRQILRNPTEWKRLFAAAGFVPVGEAQNQMVNHVCLLFAPQQAR
jgi:ubiquinone/menaquinone biosynthesis C-methylase UbiE